MNIDSKNILNISVFFSESAEAIAFLHCLCEEKHFQFGIEEAFSLKDRLSGESLEFIDFFTDGDWAFGFLYDFLVHSKEYSDLSRFITFIDKYQDVEFIYRFLDRTLSREKINELIGNTAQFNDFYREFDGFETKQQLLTIFYETTNFKARLVKLLSEIDRDLINNIYKNHAQSFNEAENYILNKITTMHPCELAQEIKGSYFPNKEYSNHYILPSFLLHHHNIISESEDSFAFYFNINIKNRTPGIEAKRLAEIFKVLSDKSRMEILRQIKGRPTFGKVLAARLKLTTGTVSRHLEQLRKIDLIYEKKINNVKYFYFNEEKYNSLFGDLDEFISSL